MLLILCTGSLEREFYISLMVSFPSRKLKRISFCRILISQILQIKRFEIIFVWTNFHKNVQNMQNLRNIKKPLDSGHLVVPDTYFRNYRCPLQTSLKVPYFNFFAIFVLISPRMSSKFLPKSPKYLKFLCQINSGNPEQAYIGYAVLTDSG